MGLSGRPGHKSRPPVSLRESSESSPGEGEAGQARFLPSFLLPPSRAPLPDLKARLSLRRPLLHHPPCPSSSPRLYPTKVRPDLRASERACRLSALPRIKRSGYRTGRAADRYAERASATSLRRRLCYLNCSACFPRPFIGSVRAALAEAPCYWLRSLRSHAHHGAREQGTELIARQLVAP